MVVEQADAIRDQRKKMQFSLMEKKKAGDVSKVGKGEKKMPEVIKSAKFIMQAKKEAEKVAAKK